jgi:hypothetical protein
MDATEQAIDQSMRITLDGVEYALKISGAGAKNHEPIIERSQWELVQTLRDKPKRHRL